MAYLKAFGAYLPARVVKNLELAAQLGCEADWILEATGIEERRFANEETVSDMALAACEDCLRRAGVNADSVGLLIVASGSYERRFPGPAASVAAALGIAGRPALDLPMASAGALFGLALADQLASVYGNVLVAAAEKMSSVVMRPTLDRNTAILFGDGAGASLVGNDGGFAAITDSILCSDGTFSQELRLEFDGPLEMNGRMVILQASRKVPAAIVELLRRNSIVPSSVDVFVMHQANQNLTKRVAQALGVAEDKFYSNVRRVGNTSSASMLIASAEWSSAAPLAKGAILVFAGFGAGFHWGALLARGV